MRGEGGRQTGRQAGRQEGRKAGRKAGRQEGRKAGRQEGRDTLSFLRTRLVNVLLFWLLSRAFTLSDNIMSAAVFRFVDNQKEIGFVGTANIKPAAVAVSFLFIAC